MLEQNIHLMFDTYLQNSLAFYVKWFNVLTHFATFFNIRKPVYPKKLVRLIKCAHFEVTLSNLLFFT